MSFSLGKSPRPEPREVVAEAFLGISILLAYGGEASFHLGTRTASP
jgi:hypothetical protein